MQEYIPTSPASPSVQFKTQDQYLQDILAPKESLTTTTGSSGTPAGTEAAPATASSYTGRTDETPPTTPQKEYSVPEGGQISVGSYNPTQVQDTYSKLFAPVQTDLAAQYGTLGNLVGQFNTQAGPTPTTQNIGQTIEQALTSGNLTPAQGLVSSKYTGPADLAAVDQAALDNLTKGWTSFLGTGRSLDTGAGAKELLRKSVPTLSPGELRAEAQTTWHAPGYQTQAEAVQKDISKFYEDFLRTQGEAQAIGKSRKATATKTSEEAKNYLTGQGEAMEGTWGSRVTSEKDRLKKIQEAYEKAKAGDYRALWEIPEEYRAGWTPGQVEAGGIDQMQAAQAQRQAILDKYPDLKDIPLMTAGTTGDGREVLQFPSDWWTAHKGDYADWSSIKAAARRRQAELEAAGLSGLNFEQNVPGVGAAIDDAFSRPLGKPGPSVPYLEFYEPQKATAGANEPYTPLYLGEDWTPTGTSPFLDLSEYGQITPETVATSPEAQRYAAIQQLLGLPEADTFKEGLDYTAPTIGFNLEGYRAQEATDLERQKAAIQEAIARYLGA